MNQCLPERALVMLSIGEGTSEERSHLTFCPSCARRCRELDADLRVIGVALRAGPPPRRAVVRTPVPVRMWMLAPAIAAAAAIVALLVGRWTPGTPVAEVALAPKTDTAALATYAEDVSAALFGASEGALFDAPATPRHPQVAEAAEVEQALGIGSPCTGTRLFGADCNDYTSALYF